MTTGARARTMAAGSGSLLVYGRRRRAAGDPMRGYRFSPDRRLAERDMLDLADALALQLHDSLGSRVYLLPRTDVAELIRAYVDDLDAEDRHDISWMIWHLFQDAREMEPPG